jgi:predicted nuclease of predicted toxin-antitoxin system
VRLLLDEHLSARLCQLLARAYPGSLHVNDLGLRSASDDAIWRAAIEHDCVLLTKDEDFQRLSVLRGAPPKVIWLRLGNASTEATADLLLSRAADVERFVSQEEAAFLALGW